MLLIKKKKEKENLHSQNKLWQKLNHLNYALFLEFPILHSGNFRLSTSSLKNFINHYIIIKIKPYAKQNIAVHQGIWEEKYCKKETPKKNLTTRMSRALTRSQEGDNFSGHLKVCLRSHWVLVIIASKFPPSLSAIRYIHLS